MKVTKKRSKGCLKAIPRFVEPATNRRTDVSKNKPIQRGSTLSGNAIRLKTEKAIFSP